MNSTTTGVGPTSATIITTTTGSSPATEPDTPPMPSPPTPPPAPSILSPSPLRYPETLNNLITIRSTPHNGLGVFALHDIPAGTILLCESPLIAFTDTGVHVDPLDTAVNGLSPERKASFRSLHGFRSNANESVNRSIMYSNGYSISSDRATGIFETASRINHACGTVANSKYVWKEGIGRMVFWNWRGLREGEEVTVDYGHRGEWLRRIYGFDCACGGCGVGGDLGDAVVVKRSGDI